MRQLVDTAREAYDLAIIEVPPMAAVVDYKMIARHCDGFVFVAEWGKTSQRIVLECLNDASVFLDRIVCIVLNKVDPSSLRSIERYKGDRSTITTAMRGEPEAVAAPISGGRPCGGSSGHKQPMKANQ